MFNKLSVLTLAIVIILSTVFASESFAQKPIKGQVVSLNSLATGGKGKVTKEEAVRLAESGNPIVFKSGSKIYFVYNEDGSFAGKRLASFANAQQVGIIGKTKKVNGIYIIIQTMIDAM